MSADIKGIGVIRGIAVGNFGRETVTQVCFYCRAEEWDRFAKDRESLIDSFHFDSDKAYSNQVASDSSPTELSPAVVGAISGAIGGLVAVLYLSSRAKKARAVEEKSAIQNDSITP